MPREPVPIETVLTVKASVKVPKGVTNDFVKAAPDVTGVGSVIVVVVPLVSPVLLTGTARMAVTRSGAPAVMVAAVVMSPVLAVKMVVGTKLKATLIATAQAGEALTAATAITVPRRAVRRENIL